MSKHEEQQQMQILWHYKMTRPARNRKRADVVLSMTCTLATDFAPRLGCLSQLGSAPCGRCDVAEFMP